MAKVEMTIDEDEAIATETSQSKHWAKKNAAIPSENKWKFTSQAVVVNTISQALGIGGKR
jgi:hypothetical protein